MKDIISRELLSEVLDKNVLCTELKYGITLDIILDINTYNRYISYNIYELAHKCKEWAWKTHNKIVSSEVSVDDWVSIVAHFYGNLEVNIEESFSGITEPEAIFKACQWILDNKDKQ